MNTASYKIIIVDDHALFADGLVRILQDETDFEIQAICQNERELFLELQQNAVDLLLLDIQLIDVNGLDICLKVKQEFPETKIILISMIEAAHVVEEARERGANGYIPKSTDASVLKDGVRKVLQGEAVFLKSEGANNELINQLSKREVEIIQKIKSGLTSKEIADELFLSEFTVKTHRKNILRKLNLNSVSELIAYAFTNHL